MTRNVVRDLRVDKSSVVEIIAVGNELLIGRIANTNAQWLAAELTLLGAQVERITMLGDDSEKISDGIRESLRRRPAWIITSGGLGPTFDDLTLQGVARALRTGLELNQAALAMIKKTYRKLVREGRLPRFELTEARLKMAMLPRKSRPLENRVGTAPGVLVSRGGTRIACLPGVPQEMQHVFENRLSPILRKHLPKPEKSEAEALISGLVESALAPFIVDLMKKYPGLYIKSHPRGFEGGVSKILLHMTLSGLKKPEGRKTMRRIVEEVARLALAEGGSFELVGEK